MTTPPTTFHIFVRRGVWWVEVPIMLLFRRERGLYHRRTFDEAISLMDFYLARGRHPRAVTHER